jgi:hypothetical protein
MNKYHRYWQNSRFWAIAFLIRFCQIASGFHFFGFRKIIFFYTPRSSSLRPTPNLKDQVSVFIYPSDRVTQALASIFVSFYDSQGDGGVIWTASILTNCSPLTSCCVLFKKLTTQFNSSAPKLISLQAGVSILDSSLLTLILCYWTLPYNHFAQNT